MTLATETVFEQLAKQMVELQGGYSWIADVAKKREQLTALSTHPSDENHQWYQ